MFILKDIDNQTLLLVSMFVLLLMNFFILTMRAIYTRIRGLGHAAIGNTFLLFSLVSMYYIGFVGNIYLTIIIPVLDLLGMTFLVMAVYVFFNNDIKKKTYIIINLLNLLFTYYFVIINNSLNYRKVMLSFFIFIIFIDGAFFLKKKYIENNLTSYKVIKYIFYIFAGYYMCRIILSYFSESSVIVVFEQNVLLSLTLIIFIFFSVLVTFTFAFMTIDTLFNNVKELSIRDPLTGLYNRRYLLYFFDNLIKEVRRGEHTFLIVLLDIDYFKEANDTFGHITGDKILQWFSSLLTTNLRESDIVGRYGGDEFIAILKDTQIEYGHLTFERILSQAKASEWVYNDRKITFSASILEVKLDNAYKSINELINDVDVKMYEAKEEGRDRILVVN
ncbi:MAG: GGDEF domain-containing protein [Vulcanibacillus sp.]